MPESGPTTSDDTFLRRARVLVCEDSPTARKFLEWLLQPLYEVCLAASGERAVQAAMEFLPDVVLCDLMLPGISGTEVFRRLRALPAFEDVPFVIMTALEDDEGRALGLEAGADDYLRKPVSERELLARVASLVRLRRSTQSLRAQNALLSRTSPDRSAEERDARREVGELEAQRQRFAFAVCALETPIAALSESLAGAARALGASTTPSAEPSAARERTLAALEGAEAATTRLRALVDELEALLDGQEPACVSPRPRVRVG
jgi:DNA-binding response OmpR family regulator